MSKVIHVPRRFRTSFATGFARRPGDSVYPDRWRGLIGAYVPAMGPRGGETLFDFSLHRRSGTVTNAVWTSGDNPKLPAWSLNFDGTGDYVQLQWFHNSGLFSIVAWAKRTATGGTHLIIDNRDGGNDGWFFGADNATDALIAKYNSVSLLSSTTFTTGAWHHVAVTSDTQTMRLYFDGVDEGSVDISSAGAISVSTNIKIGSRSFSTPNAEWTGELQQVLIYDRPLSGGEILNDYRHPLAPFQQVDFPVFLPAAAAGRIMSSLAGTGGLAGAGGIAGRGGGIAG